jgi:hypothetical protein
MWWRDCFDLGGTFKDEGLMIRAASHMPHVVGVLLAAACLAVGCSKQSEYVDVNGQVFIVTEGSNNVRLGLVWVAAFPESTAQTSVALVRAQFDSLTRAAEGIRRLRQERVDSANAAHLMRANHSLQLAIREHEAAIAKVKHLRAAINRAWDAVKAGDQSVSMKEIDDLNIATREAEQVATEKDELVEIARSKNDSVSPRPVLANPDAPWDMDEAYLEALPIGAIARAQTDANGDFTLRLPRYGRFVLAARAERRVLDTTEKYSWLIRLPDEAMTGTKVLLSNETLTTGSSPLSLVHTSR